MLASDKTNCGACGNVCGILQRCEQGQCLNPNQQPDATPPAPDASPDATPDVTTDTTPDAPAPCSPSVVIAEVFDQAGEAFDRDYVVLHNRTASSVSLAGWSVQVSNGPNDQNVWIVVPLSGSIAANGFYLVGFMSTGSGTALPTPDATSTDLINSGGSRIALVNGTSALATGATPGAFVDAVSISDGAGMEGLAVVGGSNKAVHRKANGCTDTNANALDFEQATPTPLNSASPTATCACP